MRTGRVSVFRVVDHVRQSLWFVPVMCVGAGVALSFVTHWIDGLFDYDLIPRARSRVARRLRSPSWRRWRPRWSAWRRWC